MRAFEEIFDHHHPPILAFCRHLTGQLQDAEDAVQHTFLNAYREITASNGELHLKPWLFTVARNRCLSLLRSRRTPRMQAEPALAGVSAGGAHARRADCDASIERQLPVNLEGLSAEVERREELRALVRDLGRLPEQQRAALVLAELEALSHAEIAQVLRVEPAKVRSLVHQARSSLLSTREARDTSCDEIRTQLAGATGSSSRRRTLRRHVHECAGCSEYEVAVRTQRGQLAIILPVVSGPGLREAILSGAGIAAGGGAAGAGSMGAGAGLASEAVGGASVAGGGLAGGGLAGALTTGGLTKLAVTAALVLGGGAGVAQAELPNRLEVAQRLLGVGGHSAATHSQEQPMGAPGQPGTESGLRSQPPGGPGIAAGPGVSRDLPDPAHGEERDGGPAADVPGAGGESPSGQGHGDAPGLEGGRQDGRPGQNASPGHGGPPEHANAGGRGNGNANENRNGNGNGNGNGNDGTPGARGRGQSVRDERPSGSPPGRARGGGQGNAGGGGQGNAGAVAVRATRVAAVRATRAPAVAVRATRAPAVAVRATRARVAVRATRVAAVRATRARAGRSGQRGWRRSGQRGRGRWRSGQRGRAAVAVRATGAAAPRSRATRRSRWRPWHGSPRSD